jgi:putative polyketide hydroxylase
MTGTPQDTTVLIVGAGPTGLAASIGLSHGGAGSIVIERHPGTSIHPKARGVNVRTMEIARQWGIDQALRDAGLSSEANGYFFRGPSLLADEFERTGGGGLATEVQAMSPEAWLVISQDVLEPVLLDAARSAGGEVRFGHELVGLDEDAGGVTAQVRPRDGSPAYGIRARWTIGADGADSTVRALAGVDLAGHGPLVDNVSILFEAPLGALVEDRRSAVYYVTDEPGARPRGYPMSVGNPPAAGVLLTVDNADRWLLVVAGDLATVDEAVAIDRVKRAVGRSDLPVRILGLMPWSPAARVAERYSTGRLFLAGDAAHQMTPSGAFGLNVGMGDAHNLAWKLAGVADGWADERLLGSYDAERRPVGLFATDQSYQQFLGTRPPKPFGNWGVILGARYSSDAVIDDGTTPTAVDDPAVDYVPEAVPGARAPHEWLRAGPRRLSTLDVFSRGYSLVAGSLADRWQTEATTAAERMGAPLTVFRLGVDGSPEDPGRFDREYGIVDDGAVLVRPDGHVAWRSSAGGVDARPFDEVLVRLGLGSRRKEVSAP